MAGEVASLLLSRMTVPILFYMSERKKHDRPPVEMLITRESPEGTEVPVVESPASAVENVPVVESIAVGQQQQQQSQPSPESLNGMDVGEMNKRDDRVMGFDHDGSPGDLRVQNANHRTDGLDED